MSGFEDLITKYSLEELATRHPFLKNINLKDAIHVVERPIHGSNNITRIDLYSDQSENSPRRSYFKKEFAQRAGSESLTRAYGRDEARLFTNAKRAYSATEREAVASLLPKVVGEDTDNLVLYLSEMKGNNLREIILNAHSKENNSKKEDIIFDAAKKFGIIEGALSLCSESFQDVSDYSVERRLERITDYLSTILIHTDPKFLDGGNSVRAMLDVARDRYMSRGINITHTLDKIAEQSHVLINQLRPGLGDARLRHLFSNNSGQFGAIDIEYMGQHPRIHSLISMTNMEAGISRPNPEKLRPLVATYLAFYNASRKQALARKSRNKRDKKGKNAIRALKIGIRRDYKDGKINNRIIKESGGDAVVDRVLLEYLAFDIEENLHMLSTNLRASEESLLSWTEGINGYSIDDMNDYRKQRIVDNMNYFVSDKKRILGNVGGETVLAFESLMTKYALLLDRLEIVSIDSPILRLHGGSYSRRQ